MFDLTHQQKAIIDSMHKRIMVNAGPGSGKTTTLSCVALKQARSLVDNPPSWINDDANVLFVSLTNAAANNARATTNKLIQDNCIIKALGSFPDNILNKIYFSTIHGFSFRMLKRYKAIHRYSMVVVESDEDILNKIISEITPAWEEDETIIAMLLDIINQCTKGQKVKDVIRHKYPEHAKHPTVIQNILNQLNHIKHKDKIITFDDMMHDFHKLLHKSKIRKQIIRRYPIIIVDEFQDTGSVQWKIIKQLTKPSKSYLLCAGDDGQTIFTWAGASFYRFKHFQQRFPKGRTYQLTKNLRSTKQITALSNALMNQSLYTIKKKMRSNEDGNKPKIVFNDNPLRLYDYIYRRIQWNLKDGKTTYNDMAILYRFYKDAYFLKGYLSSKGIPFKVYGDKSKRDRPIIKTIFSLIRIIESSTIRKKHWGPMLLKIEGIGEKSIDKIMIWLKDKDAKDSIYPKHLRYTDSLQELLEFINKMKQSTSPNWVKMKEIVDYIYKLPKTNKSLIEHIPPTLIKLAHESKTLSGAINKYNDRSYPFYYPGVFEPPYPDHYVTLSTVHRIKGGEFNTVFYLGTNDILFKEYGLFKNKKRIENELQLLNVAVTRAREELHLLFPIDIKTWGSDETAANPWRFIRDVYRKLDRSELEENAIQIFSKCIYTT